MDAQTIRVMRYGQLDEIIDLHSQTDDFSGHGGGDAQLIKDFITLLQGKEVPGSRLSSIDRSVESHLVALAAERSRLNGGEVVEMYHTNP